MTSKGNQEAVENGSQARQDTGNMGSERRAETGHEGPDYPCSALHASAENLKHRENHSVLLYGCRRTDLEDCLLG